MDLRLIYALILTILPITELRAGLPLAIIYALENNIPVISVFITIVLLNILLVFFVFYFLDNIHSLLMKIKIYNKIFNAYVKKIQKRTDKFEKKYSSIGFLALVLFVAVPLPGTGAWSGCLLSWLLDLKRKRSVLAISIGIFIAGIIILFGTLGIIGAFS